ncbi:hypothetical protein HK103_005381 [Boothiomyces macroporosus]|uniref:Glycolipid transfer protein domain-containing protein n=1 Tax=Boothiomyces macroporosus TaxID=261099 RepID=A0AAD5ULM2_9FUNG|nr:hypothetical protein HK103_005381 [Boothiomyces macroporosus]
MTFFDQNPASFKDANLINGEVETIPFLNSVEVLVKLLDSLGSAFSPVRSDIQGNVTKLKTRYDQFPDKSKTLQSIVISEKPEKKRIATEALLWLKRGLEFTCLALKLNLENGSEELQTSFTKAYEQKLSKHHSFLIRPIFSVAMKACPYRKDFYANLSHGEDQKLNEQLKSWVAGLDEKLKVIVDFYQKENIQ